LKAALPVAFVAVGTSNEPDAAASVPAVATHQDEPGRPRQRHLPKPARKFGMRLASSSSSSSSYGDGYKPRSGATGAHARTIRKGE
jgi:hypothetical protein